MGDPLARVGVPLQRVARPDRLRWVREPVGADLADRDVPAADRPGLAVLLAQLIELVAALGLTRCRHLATDAPGGLRVAANGGSGPGAPPRRSPSTPAAPPHARP